MPMRWKHFVFHQSCRKYTYNECLGVMIVFPGGHPYFFDKIIGADHEGKNDTDNSKTVINSAHGTIVTGG